MEHEPVSPNSLVLTTEKLPACIYIVSELERPLTLPQLKCNIDKMLSKNLRLSCLPKKDGNGKARWVPTDVNVDDHLRFPEFPEGLEYYDEYVQNYMAELHLNAFKPSIPLWEFHVMNYKTQTGGSTILLRFHHEIGDGVSLISLFKSCVDRPHEWDIIDNCVPDNPQRKQRKFRSPTWFIICKNTIIELASFLFNPRDSNSPLKGHSAIQSLPMVFASSCFDLNDLKAIKNALGVTVNDVLVGIIFGGVQMFLAQTLQYEHENAGRVQEIMKKWRITLVAFMNLRDGYEASKPGNRFWFGKLRVPLQEYENVLDYVHKAKTLMDRNKHSHAKVIMGNVLRYITKFVGAKRGAMAAYNMLDKATLSVSNLIGPTKTMTVSDVPIKSLSFYISGIPLELTMGALSYAGILRLHVAGVKGMVDVKLLCENFNKCYQDLKSEVTVQ